MQGVSATLVFSLRSGRKGTVRVSTESDGTWEEEGGGAQNNNNQKVKQGGKKSQQR